MEKNIEVKVDVHPSQIDPNDLESITPGMERDGPA